MDNNVQRLRQRYGEPFLVAGIYLGYPLCCISAMARDFCQETKTRYPDGAWYGSGFVPCVKCAEGIHTWLDFNQFIQTEITPYRIAPYPFSLTNHRLPQPDKVREVVEQYMIANPDSRMVKRLLGDVCPSS